MDGNIKNTDIVKMKYIMRGEIPVRLTLTSQHIVPDIEVMNGIMPSYFTEGGSMIDGFTDMDEPDEMEEDEEIELDESSDSSVCEEAEEDTYTFCTTAGMRSECGVITISYEESEGGPAEIIYDTGVDGMVTIHRSGSFMGTLVLERGRRHITVYKLPVGNFTTELAVCAKKVETNLTLEDGGEINLDYLVELRGLDMQRTIMKIKVEKM